MTDDNARADTPGGPAVTEERKLSMHDRQCHNCANSELADGGFDCRRYPPQIAVDPEDDMVKQYWPKVNPDGWCGEWTIRNALATN